MAVVNQILHRKNSSGTYDTVYLQSNLSNVTGTLGIANGGTGATDATTARSNLGAAASSHTHGNVTNAGAITATGVTIASGDALVFTDSSASGKLVKSSITFDGSTTTQALTKKGTWESFNNYSHPSTKQCNYSVDISGKQDKLVSGTNIKTINNNSIVGSGNINIPSLPSVTTADNDKILTVVNGVWTKSDPGIWSDYTRVGGRIFYDNGANEWNYKFYDVNKNEITDRTISGLANAYYYRYQVLSTKTKDRWFVYDNNTNLVQSKKWGKYGKITGITANTIGSGKTNTEAMMSMNPDGTMWTWLRDTINGNYVGGCSDWFIASHAEQDKLRASNLVNWYSNRYIWSSVEYSNNDAYGWYSGSSSWGGGNKDTNGDAFAARAF